MWKRQESNPTGQFTYPWLFEKEIDQKWKDSHLGCLSAGRFCPELGGMLKINRQTLGGWRMDRELPSYPKRKQEDTPPVSLQSIIWSEGLDFPFSGVRWQLTSGIIDKLLFEEKLSARLPWPVYHLESQGLWYAN